VIDWEMEVESDSVTDQSSMLLSLSEDLRSKGTCKSTQTCQSMSICDVFPGDNSEGDPESEKSSRSRSL